MQFEKTDTKVVGRVDYDMSGHESSVITIYIEGGKIHVGSSMCLPSRHQQARRVLACMTEAFEIAESILSA